MHDLTLSNSLADLAARIRTEHEAAGGALKRSLQHAVAAGDLLIEAKAQLRHGQWLPWLSEHCQIPERTARLYMRLAKNKIEIGNVADLTVRGAVALLASPLAKGRRQPARLKRAKPECPGCGGNGYFRGGDSGRCYCACGSPLQSKTSTSPDCSRSGVSQVSTAPEKLTSGLPTGPDFPKTPTEQATVVETQAQPNPIIAAWHASTLVQREEFIEDLGDFIADWHFSPSTPISIALSIRILQNLIHSLGERDQQPISSVSLSKQSTDAEEEETGNQTADDGLTIPNYLKRPAP